MPVTAKLSRRFYEKFGDEIANELVDWFNAVDATYKADLYALNERNFQRFDDKLERRLGELRAELVQSIAELRAEVVQSIAELRAELRGDLAESRSESERGIAGLRNEFQRDLGEAKSSLLRWMFGFWIGTLAPLAGLVVYLTAR